MSGAVAGALSGSVTVEASGFFPNRSRQRSIKRPSHFHNGTRDRRRSSGKGHDGKIEQDHQRDDHDQKKDDQRSGQTQVSVEQVRRDLSQQAAGIKRNTVDLEISDEQGKDAGGGEDKTDQSGDGGCPDPELRLAEIAGERLPGASPAARRCRSPKVGCRVSAVYDPAEPVRLWG